MLQNQQITLSEFTTFYAPVIKGYSESFKNHIKPLDEILGTLYNEHDVISITRLLSTADAEIDIYFSSLIYRLVGVRDIIFCREKNEGLDIVFVWNLISKSIRMLPVEFTISSIGSQGFLSIPLYKFDVSLEKFDFIRLHIWDDSLNQYMDLEKCEDFSIHSHTFFAKSWALTGKVKNDRYDFLTNSLNASHSFFEVIYDKSLNQVNRHTSKAVNKQINAELFKISEEVYHAHGYYEIKPSKLHKSGHLNSPDTSATFFSFTGKDGLGESFVIGPKTVRESEVNRKMNISPIYLLDKIDNQL